MRLFGAVAEKIYGNSSLVPGYKSHVQLAFVWDQVEGQGLFYIVLEKVFRTQQLCFGTKLLIVTWLDLLS